MASRHQRLAFSRAFHSATEPGEPATVFRQPARERCCTWQEPHICVKSQSFSPLSFAPVNSSELEITAAPTLRTSAWFVQMSVRRLTLRRTDQPRRISILSITLLAPASQNHLSDIELGDSTAAAPSPGSGRNLMGATAKADQSRHNSRLVQRATPASWYHTPNRTGEQRHSNHPHLPRERGLS